MIGFSQGDIQKINQMYQCNGQTGSGGYPEENSGENSGESSGGSYGSGNKPNNRPSRPNRPNRPNGFGAALVNGIGGVFSAFG